MEYADTLWDPTDKRSVDSLEKIQSKAVRFIRNFKGRESVTEAKTLLGLVPLADRRKKSPRFSTYYENTTGRSASRHTFIGV